jgi:hypothetical protein
MFYSFDVKLRYKAGAALFDEKRGQKEAAAPHGHVVGRAGDGPGQ